jgi:hypothetical protein
MKIWNGKVAVVVRTKVKYEEKTCALSTISQKYTCNKIPTTYATSQKKDLLKNQK